MNAPLRRSGVLALAALVASSGTLVCCVLPAAMVALGAGATLAGIVSAVPQLVWLSANKALVFAVAAAALAVAGVSIRRARLLPCPADPVLAHSCERLRRFSAIVWTLAAVAFAAGATFAFILPRLAQ